MTALTIVQHEVDHLVDQVLGHLPVPERLFGVVVKSLHGRIAEFDHGLAPAGWSVSGSTEDAAGRSRYLRFSFTQSWIRARPLSIASIDDA